MHISYKPIMPQRCFMDRTQHCGMLSAVHCDNESLAGLPSSSKSGSKCLTQHNCFKMVPAHTSGLQDQQNMAASNLSPLDNAVACHLPHSFTGRTCYLKRPPSIKSLRSLEVYNSMQQKLHMISVHDMTWCDMTRQSIAQHGRHGIVWHSIPAMLCYAMPHDVTPCHVHWYVISTASWLDATTQHSIA